MEGIVAIGGTIRNVTLRVCRCSFRGEMGERGGRRNLEERSP